MSIKAAIIGAAGLSGLELIRILTRHPHVELTTVTSNKYSGKPVGEVFSRLDECPLRFVSNQEEVSGVDVTFLAVPNQASLDWTPLLLKEGIKVVDLSGVFRLPDLGLFEKYYKLKHTATDALRDAVFGLTEWNREAIASAQLVANPGCYPTGSLLGILPFSQRLAVLGRPPLIDAKSGVSGAGGRVEDDSINYVGVNENFRAYKAFGHQHWPEIHTYLEAWSPFDAKKHGNLIFTPHLLPLNRGILSTIYLHFKTPQSPDEVWNEFHQFANANPFVRLLPKGTLPELNQVQHTNRCLIGLAHNETFEDWMVVTAIDNLLKGASGQAVQNMNLMFGFEESTGLL